ncbi:hypothetical protein HNR46_000452 [Haloferula luteola]|uniref:DUF3857 domain-containing protein n=1 Tax=Haloferula luteola TaxID=595692 RepID=A0A840V615_9BACT|nr:DUF3857 domain-containing protein [Haloferula luteola]MBB5350228.1 hypothetical protein [Haloferula luteola]
MRDWWVLIFLFLVGTTLCPAEEMVGKTPTPEWVQSREVKKSENDDGSLHYYLVDLQRHLEEAQRYERYVVGLLNESGVEEYSQLTFEFQPEYEVLELHELSILRDGEIDDRLADAEVQILRREEGMEEQLYSGALTALVVLEDLRPGDVLSYAFSIRGANPVFGGHVHHFQRLGFGTPVDHLSRSIVWDPEKRKLAWKFHGPEVTGLQQSQRGELKQLLWEDQEVAAWNPEEGTPVWVFDYPWWEVSDYPSWEAFGEWAHPLFSKSEALPKEVAEVCESIRDMPGDDEQKILSVLRWVQKNIRYLGSFFGEHTHEPYRLEEICRRRFGDCKDKGMLTLAMLKELGYDASPALVNSSRRRGVESYLPGHGAFDHFVVCLHHGGKDYWLDPTATYRRGPLAEMFTPNYGKAFVVRHGEEDLTQVEPRGEQVDGIDVEEHFTVLSKQGGARLRVVTVATGAEADSLRSYLSERSREKVTQEYRDFYATSWVGIEASETVEVNDDETLNRIEVIEHYELPEFWQRDEDASKWNAWISPVCLRSRLRFPAMENRSSLYAQEYPLKFHERIEVDLPEEWQVEESEDVIEDPAFVYQGVVQKEGRRVILDHRFESRSGVVKSTKFRGFVKSMKRVEDNLPFQIWHTDESVVDQNEAAIAEGVESDVGLGKMIFAGGALVGSLLGVLVGLALWFWDPLGREATDDAPVGISGWLVLPTIGVVIGPFVSLIHVGSFYTILQDAAPILQAESGFGGWRLYIASGAFLNAFVFVIQVLLLVLLIQRRTSFPYVYLVVGVVGTIAGSVLIQLETGLDGMESDTSATGDLGRGVGTLVLWSAYMLMSQRVKATFDRRRAGSEPPPIPAQVEWEG